MELPIMEYDEIVAGLRKMTYSSFAQSLLRQYDQNGGLTYYQWDAAERAIHGHQKREQAKAQRVEMDYMKIETLLFKARANGLKKPVFRACGMTFSLAPSTGKNPGAVYVKTGGEYIGKLNCGRWYPSQMAAPDVAERLAEIVADPKGKAIEYGRETGRCACCGRTLTDPKSIELGIGPICLDQWGL